MTTVEMSSDITLSDVMEVDLDIFRAFMKGGVVDDEDGCLVVKMHGH